jgi:NDP-sugar pyrophosphorylase family protein
MKALILATDEQQRLPVLTERRPGPLLPILDRPVIDSTLEILARSGHREILVSLYNRGGAIAAYIGSGKRWGVNIRYVIQRQAWGSAGSLKWAAGLLDETFLVLPGDALLDLDIDAALAFHRSHGGPATLILKQSVIQPTGLHVADDGRITPANSNLVGGHTAAVTGAYIFEPEILEHIAAHQPGSIIDDLLPHLLDAGIPVFGYEMAGYWNPLDTTDAFQQAQQVVLYSAYTQSLSEPPPHGPVERVRFPTLSGRQVAPGIWVGQNDSIHPSVKIAAPIFLGANCWIGREVELDSGSVIGSDVVIDEEATISASTVLSRTYVGQLVRINDRIVDLQTMIDAESGESIKVVDPFLLSTVGDQPVSRSWASQVAVGLVILPIIALLSPLLLIVWLLAFITSGGRPIARSRRLGHRISTITDDTASALHGFDLIHFQTRRADGSYLFLGRWMENLELHRLPELFNVLRGDLALVGVKPLLPEEVAQLDAEWHQQRHETRAGMTGLWYVQTEPNSDLDSIIVADVYYTATRTWRDDVALMVRTPAAWFRRHTRRLASVGGDEETVIRPTT